jgi:drug/metabolite transporter (DMT)-like permease
MVGACCLSPAATYREGNLRVDAYTGELAGLMTSVCWSFTSIFFTLSGQIVGSPVVNRTRLVLALVMVSTVHWLTEGQFLPVYAEPARWGWLALSGLIGFVIGDALLFQAFVMIGARLSMLLMALNPVMGAVLAWVLLGETLAPLELLGIGLAVSGVVWVVSDRRNGATRPATLPDTGPRYYLVGVLFGLGGALGQASGLLASKQGLTDDFSAFSGNLMRLTTATVTMWLLALMMGHAPRTVRAIRDNPRALRFITIGAIAGPFIGVWMSLVAVQNAKIGIASTLMSLTPIILLPLGRLFFDERITRRAILGTLFAVAGVAVIFLA